MNKITSDIPVIDRNKIPNDIWKLINKEYFGDDALNAFQLLYLVDKDNNSPLEQVTKWLRDNGIQGDRVLIDNTW